MNASAPTIQRPALLGGIAFAATVAMLAACLSLMAVAHANGGWTGKRVLVSYKAALMSAESR